MELFRLYSGMIGFGRLEEMFLGSVELQGCRLIDARSSSPCEGLWLIAYTIVRVSYSEF